MESDYIRKQKQLVYELETSFARRNNKFSIVDMQEDYANDDRICLTSVTFIPRTISDNIIVKVIKPLKRLEPNHYFYLAESMHLTVKNIRTIHKPPLFNQSDIEKVDDLFRKVVPDFQSFNLYIEDVVLFPTSVSVMGYGDDVLQELVSALNAGLNEIGVPDNKRYLSNSVFWGNITLCRFTHEPGQDFIEMVKKLRDIRIGRLRVSEISLIVCNAVCYKKTREIISEYRLK